MAKKKKPVASAFLVLLLVGFTLFTVLLVILSLLLVLGVRVPLLDGESQARRLPVLYAALAAGALLWRFAPTVGRRQYQNTRVGFAVLYFATVGFVLISFILSKTANAEHFSGPESPGAVDWTVYLFNHLLRAGDLLDFLEAYGVRLSDLRPASARVRVAVAAYYAVVSALVTGVLLASQNKPPTGKPRRNWLKVVSVAALVPGVILYVMAGVSRGWPAGDWVLWPVEQLARMLDIADLMNLFDWHFVPKDTSYLTGTAAMCFRLGVGAWVIQYVGRKLGVASVVPEDGTAGEPVELAQPDADELRAVTVRVRPTPPTPPAERATRYAAVRVFAGPGWVDHPEVVEFLARGKFRPRSQDETFRLAFLKGDYHEIVRGGTAGTVFLLTYHAWVECPRTLLALARLEHLEPNRSLPMLLGLWARLARSAASDPRFARGVTAAIERLLDVTPCPLTDAQLRECGNLPDLPGTRAGWEIRAKVRWITNQRSGG